MQRKDIDALELSDLRAGLVDAKTSEGVITVTSGQHPLYGVLILIEAAGACAVLGNDVHLIVGEGETIETDTEEAAA